MIQPATPGCRTTQQPCRWSPSKAKQKAPPAPRHHPKPARSEIAISNLLKFDDFDKIWKKFGDFDKILIKFGDFDKIWNLVKFEILNPKITKFEILNPNTKISNLDTEFLNFDDFCYKFEENFTEIDKIGDNPKFDEITKFEILNPKIQNFQFRQNLTKNHQILSKSPNFFTNFIKIIKNFNRFEIAISLFQNFDIVDIAAAPKSAKIGLNQTSKF